MAAVTVAVSAFLACSSDDVSPLGTELVGDLLGSTPGTVFVDTVDVVSDTVLAFGTAIVNRTTLELGRSDGYQRTMILQPDFSTAGDDTGRTVQSADLRIIEKSADGAMRARFYKLRDAYKEGDTLSTLDTLSAIVDPNTSSAERTLTSASARHALPPSLVQGWIKGDSVSTAIAIVYTDEVNDLLATYGSRINVDDVTIKVTFDDGGDEVTYRIKANATFVRPTTTTSNLIVSDGFVRRMYFRIDLSQLSDSAATHSVHARFHVVPGTVRGDNRTVILYIPASGDVTSPEFRSGAQVVSTTVNESEEIVDFTLTNSLLGVLSEVLPDNGFVVRFAFENSAIRAAEFYGSAATDTLRPRVFITSSTPAEFDR